MVIEDVAGGPVWIGQTCFNLAENDRHEDGHRGHHQIPEAHFEEISSSRDHTNQIKKDADQRHRDHKVHHDWMNDIQPGEVFVVERWKQLEHRQAEQRFLRMISFQGVVILS